MDRRTDCQTEPLDTFKMQSEDSEMSLVAQILLNKKVSRRKKLRPLFHNF